MGITPQQTTNHTATTRLQMLARQLGASPYSNDREKIEYIYEIGFIAVQSQKIGINLLSPRSMFMSNWIANDLLIKNFLRDYHKSGKSGYMNVLDYAKSLGQGVTFLRRLSVRALVQSIAACYAGHFSMFVSRQKVIVSDPGGQNERRTLDPASIERVVAGFNPENLLGSFTKSTHLKAKGTLPGKWWDDALMFSDPTRRVISVRISEGQYQIAHQKVMELRSNIITEINQKPMYAWYGMDNIKIFNCVTNSVCMMERIINSEIFAKCDHGSLSELKIIIDNMKSYMESVIINNKGTLTHFYWAMQEGIFLLDWKKNDPEEYKSPIAINNDKKLVYPIKPKL